MQIKSIVIALALVGALSACDTNAQNAGVGALGGAAVATVFGGNVATAAAVGAAGGALCKDSGVCK